MQILKNAKPNESHIITLKFVVKTKENKIVTNSISLYYVKNISNTVFVLEKFVWGVCQEFQKRFWDNSVYCDFYIGGDWSLSQ